MSGNPTPRVLLVSALPPPPGGIASWTQTMLDRGLPPPYQLEVVDTRVYRQSQFTPSRPTPAEIWRNLKILNRIRRALTSGRFSVMHLNCGLTLSGVPRNLASALIARRAGVPYVAHLRGTFHLPDGNGPSQRFYRSAWQRIFSGAARILALGQPSYQAIQQLGDFSRKTIPLLPNFVDVQGIPHRPPPIQHRLPKNHLHRRPDRGKRHLHHPRSSPTPPRCQVPASRRQFQPRRPRPPPVPHPRSKSGRPRPNPRPLPQPPSSHDARRK